jgi:hypothetical protein
MLTHPTTQRTELWPIGQLIFYARNPWKNDSAVNRMCSSICEFGFKVPMLARKPRCGLCVACLQFTSEVLAGLLRIGFLDHQADHLGQGTRGAHSNSLLVPT